MIDPPEPQRHARDLGSHSSSVELIRPEPAFWTLLAGLRFFFAFWVLSDHTYNFGPAERAIPVLSKSGLVAVLCFLVISGFSMAQSLATKPSGFYARRFWRVVPVNLVALAICAFGFGLAGKLWVNGAEYECPNLATWIIHALFLQAIIPPIMPAFFPSWSLAIEVIYYAIAPLLLHARAAALLIASIVSCAFFVAWPSISQVYIAQAPYGYAVVAFAFAWLVGWLAYKMPGNLLLSAFATLLGWAAIFADPYGFAMTDKLSRVSNYAAWIAIVAVIVARSMVRQTTRQTTEHRKKSDLSFPLYLVHYPVLFVASTLVWRYHPGANHGIIHVLLSLAVAHATLCLTDRSYTERTVRLIASMPFLAAMAAGLTLGLLLIPPKAAERHVCGDGSVLRLTTGCSPPRSGQRLDPYFLTPPGY